MNPSEAAQVLTLAAVFDNRTFDAATTRVWADALDGLELRDCLDAVRAHYRHTRQWLMPSDLRDQARSVIRSRREVEQRQIDALALEQGNPDPEVAARRAELIQQTIEASYRMPTEESPHPKTDAVRDRKARAVACPWCHAPERQPCTNTSTGQRAVITHEARLIAAGLIQAPAKAVR